MKQTIKLNEKDLTNLVIESAKMILTEGSSFDDTSDKWNWLLNNIGAEKMLDCIYAWCSSDMIDKFIQWFSEEEYLDGYHLEHGNDMNSELHRN